VAEEQTLQPKTLRIDVPALKTDKWEGGRLVNGEFVRAFVLEDLATLIMQGVRCQLTDRDYPTGTRVLVTVVIDPATE
jgi:hypothetical protein